MTELEITYSKLLEQEKSEREQERNEVAKEQNELKSMFQSLSKQNEQIIELLQKPMDSVSIEDTLAKLLAEFQISLTASLTASLDKLTKSQNGSQN